MKSTLWLLARGPTDGDPKKLGGMDHLVAARAQSLESVWTCSSAPFPQLTLYFMVAVPTNPFLSLLPNEESHCIMCFMAIAPSHSIFLTFLLSLPSLSPPQAAGS